MLDHIGLAVSDFAKSKAFFQAALAPLGYNVKMDFGEAIGFGQDRPISGLRKAWSQPGCISLSPPPIARRSRHFTMPPSRRVAKTTEGPGCVRSIIRTTTARSFMISTATTSRRSAISRNDLVGAVREPPATMVQMQQRSRSRKSSRLCNRCGSSATTPTRNTDEADAYIEAARKPSRRAHESRSAAALETASPPSAISVFTTG